ncbi:MAG: DUF4012 domain-containing protein [Acidimicrobiia bacterium]
MDLNPAVLVVEPAAFAAAAAVLRYSHRVEAWRPSAVALVAGLSAGAAGMADGSPTGLALLDVVLLAALGAAGALAGLWARPPWLLAAAVVAAAAGVGGLGFPLALAALGLVLATLLVQDEPVINGVAGALVVQASLRLAQPQEGGMTALVAAVALGLLFVPVTGRLRRQRRRLVVRAAVGAGVVAVLGAFALGVAGLMASDPLRRGLSTATATIRGAQAADASAAAEPLAAARRDFAEARSVLESPWVWPARAVPVVAQHWRVLREAARSGHELAGAAHRALSAPALSDVHISGGRVPVERLAAVEPTMADVAGRVSEARRRLDGVRSMWLVPPVRAELDEQRRRIAGIERTSDLALRAMPLVPRLLGQDGPRRYFLALQTPAEARAGGGFIGNFGEITADRGRLELVRFGRQSELTDAAGAERRRLHTAPDEFLARYGRFNPERHWANVNLSPDFPTDARVIADLYPQSGGAPIDGVIAVDPAGLAALLRVVGPLRVPSWPEPITADNALQVLLADQYHRYEAQAEDLSGRIDFLGEVAQEAWRRLTTDDLPPLPELLAALGPAVGDKHILLFSTRPDEQGLFVDMGAAGEMAPVRGDFIGLVTQNASGNKIDYFLRREIDYRVQLDGASGGLQATATVALHNEAPASGLAPSVIGNQLRPRLPDGSNKLFLSFYTPWELTGARIAGAPVELERATELGRRVYSTSLVIPPRSTVVLELTLVGRLPPTDRYRLDVHRQTMVAPDRLTAAVTVAGRVLPVGDPAIDLAAGTPIDDDTTFEAALGRG